MCVYNIFNNPKGFTKYFLNISRVFMCYNLPASLFTLQGINNPLPYLYIFRWILVYIPPGYFLNLGRGFFLNRGEPSMILKAILILRYVYNNSSPGGVLYTF